MYGVIRGLQMRISTCRIGLVSLPVLRLSTFRFSRDSSYVAYEHLQDELLESLLCK